MKKYLIAVLIIVVLFFILGFLPEPQQKTGNVYQTTTVSVGDAEVLAEISDTNVLRALGLSGRESLEDGKGMLFVFDSAGHHGFWMKNMKFSIDIVWADENKIVFIEESVSPTTFPKIFSPTIPARFALEVPAGFVSTHQLKVGDFFSTGL
jgi:uncharacterized membrane protein (UPF0127 family)